jgi:hypothetical protein
MGVAHKSTQAYVVRDAPEVDFFATDHAYVILAGPTHSILSFHRKSMTFYTVSRQQVSLKPLY